MSSYRPVNPKFNPQALRFIAIDTGTHGAICGCSLVTGKITLHKLDGQDPEELLPVLDNALGDINLLDCVVVEQPPYFMGTIIPSARIAVLFESFGIIVGYLMARGVKIVRVTPKVWQERLHDIIGKRGNMKHGDWKKVLTEYAKGKYEGIDNLIGQTSDSLLIAEWWMNEGYYTYSNEKKPIKKKPSKKGKNKTESSL